MAYASVDAEGTTQEDFYFMKSDNDGCKSNFFIVIIINLFLQDEESSYLFI